MFVVYTEHDLTKKNWQDSTESVIAQELKVGTPFIGCLDGPSGFLIVGIFGTWKEAVDFKDNY